MPDREILDAMPPEPENRAAAIVDDAWRQRALLEPSDNDARLRQYRERRAALETTP